MNKVMWFVVVVLLIIGLGVWYYYSRTPAPQTSQVLNSSPSSTVSTTSVTITYTSSGFTPNSVSVKTGSKVTFVNNSNQEVQVNSNPHPIHTDETELNVGSIAPGQSGSIVVTKIGTWGYHNHLKPGQGGTLVVQ